MNPHHHREAERIYTENHEHAARVIAARHHRHPQDAQIQDAVAQATMRLLQYLQRGGTIEPDTERGWLITVTGREYLRPYERAESRLTSPMDEVVEGTIPIRDPSPEQTAIRRATEVGVQRSLDRALARLSPLQRKVLTAQASGLTYHQIAERTGMSYRAVSKAVIRANRRLRQDGQLAKDLAAWRA